MVVLCCYVIIALMLKHTACVTFTQKSALERVLEEDIFFRRGFSILCQKKALQSTSLIFMLSYTHVVSCCEFLVFILHYIPGVHKFILFYMCHGCNAS